MLALLRSRTFLLSQQVCERPRTYQRHSRDETYPACTWVAGLSQIIVYFGIQGLVLDPSSAPKWLGEKLLAHPYFTIARACEEFGHIEFIRREDLSFANEDDEPSRAERSIEETAVMKLAKVGSGGGGAAEANIPSVMAPSTDIAAISATSCVGYRGNSLVEEGDGNREEGEAEDEHRESATSFTNSSRSDGSEAKHFHLLGSNNRPLTPPFDGDDEEDSSGTYAARSDPPTCLSYFSCVFSSSSSDGREVDGRDEFDEEEEKCESSSATGFNDHTSGLYVRRRRGPVSGPPTCLSSFSPLLSSSSSDGR